MNLAFSTWTEDIEILEKFLEKFRQQLLKEMKGDQ
jgi:hypothetical protein